MTVKTPSWQMQILSVLCMPRGWLLEHRKVALSKRLSCLLDSYLDMPSVVESTPCLSFHVHAKVLCCHQHTCPFRQKQLPGATDPV